MKMGKGVRVWMWVCGLLKAFCQGAGCCHEWEELFGPEPKSLFILCCALMNMFFKHRREAQHPLPT